MSVALILLRLTRYYYPKDAFQSEISLSLAAAISRAVGGLIALLAIDGKSAADAWVGKAYGRPGWLLLHHCGARAGNAEPHLLVGIIIRHLLRHALLH